MNGTPDFYLQSVVAPIVVALLFILATSRFKEPNRRHFMAIMIAGAGAAYLSGGFGVWELVFTAVVTACAYKGLNSYRFIGLGWILPTIWDVLHHLFGNPIIPFLPASSIGCAVCDLVIALWCFGGVPAGRLALSGGESRATR
jgi:Family of unknown function (DUF6010)